MTIILSKSAVRVLLLTLFALFLSERNATAAFAVKVEAELNGAGGFIQLDGGSQAGTNPFYDKSSVATSYDQDTIDPNVINVSHSGYNLQTGSPAFSVSGLTFSINASTDSNAAASFINQVSTTAALASSASVNSITLRVTVTNTFTTPLEPNKNLISSTSLGNGSIYQLVSFQSYVDTAAGEFVLGAVTTGLQTPATTEHTAYQAFTDPNSYSITSVMVFTINRGEGVNNLSGRSTVIAPAPTSMLLVLAALPVVGLCGFARRRRQQLAPVTCSVA